MCNKKRFDKIGAMIAIATNKKSKSKKRNESRYYYCKYCKSYHLTSKEQGR